MPPTAARRLGVIGLGRMGSAICERLVARGFDVTGHDLRPELRRSAVAAGAGWADSVSELAARSEVVLTVLPGDEEVEAVRETLLAALAPGGAWVEMSSATPEAARRIAATAGRIAAATERGPGRASASAPGSAGRARLRVLDAPLGGGPADARAGRLLMFAGGAPEDLARVSDVLDAIAERVLHVGPHGSGYLTKLLVNLLWFGQAVACAEALAIGARAGLDLRTLRSALAQSAAGGRFLDEPAGALLDGETLDTFPLTGCVRELGDIVEIARASEVPAPVAELVADVYALALARYGDIDGELLAARLVLERAGIEPPR
ncbi:MAG TPA: NAD(P)-dependent oxidoreductase [Solirubrobacteraceae bacterium]|nr:NAD(P)-dependent oxidoreductase [Solirubrobacteraceae bacterium]